MNTNQNIINDFANTLRNHRARSKVSLYSGNQSQCNSGVEKLNIKEVISSVANQLKAIQNADSVRKLPSERNIPDILQKSHFLPVHNLIPLDQPSKQSHQFETQCVLDAQLINIIDNAEAIIDVQKGMTQEFNTTFYGRDLENCNTSTVDINVFKLKTTSSNRAVDKKMIVSKSKDLIQSNKDDALFKSHNDKGIIEDIGNGMTQEFDTTFYHKDLHNAEDSNDSNYFIENKKKYPDIFKEDKDNIPRVILKDIDYELNDIVNNEQGPCAINILTPTEENVTSDSTLTDLVLNKDLQLKDVCDFDKQSIFYFNTHEDDNNNCSKDEIITNCFVERPTSPILNKIQCKMKSNTPSPLIFKLDSFEKFESIVMPIIETHDIETAKRVINSQIFNKELFIYTHDEAVLSDRDKACTDAKYKDIKHSTQEESIVFSSDEESTLTCNLQNSFEHEPEISGEIMYVGFQTGSNRPIQISSDSYYKAKNIFENITNVDRVNPSEFNVRNTDFDEYSRNKNGGNLSIHETNKLDTNVQGSFRNSTDRLIDDTLVEEFSTDLIPDHKINKSPIIEMIKDNKAITPIPDKALMKTNNNKSTNNNFVGFKTANNKMIKVSVQALMKTKNIVESLDKDDDCLPHKSEKRSLEKSHLLQKTRSNPENIKSAFQDTTSDNNFILLSSSTSFKNNADNIRVMGEGKSQISKSLEIKPYSMKKIPHLTHEIDPDYILQGFETLSNKSVKISESALAKTKNVLLDSIIQNSEVFNENGDSVVHSFKGFTTASNKPVKISESALAKTKNIFQDIVQNEDTFYNGGDTVVHSSTTFKGFTTASNKPVKISESALAKTKNIFQDIVQNEDTFDNGGDTVVHSSNTFKGFTTASNKPVKISESALAKTKNIFQDIVQNEDTFDNGGDTVEHSSNTFKGFTTASNKPVKISKSAFAKTKNIFQDIVPHEKIFDNGGDTAVHSSNAFKGFTTAGKKPVKISETALAKTKNIFQDIVQNEEKFDNGDDTVVHSSNTFKGFTTASNKPVKISEIALAKTKNIFQDIVQNEETLDNGGEIIVPDIELKGFTTASNKPVKISKNALTKTKNILQDVIENVEINDDVFHCTEHPGFTTVNKKLSLSEIQLRKCKENYQNIFDNEAQKYEFNNLHNKIPDTNYDDTKPPFQGFKTASNKCVKVSKEALFKTKNIFQDIDVENYKESKNMYNDLDNILKEKHCNKLADSSKISKKDLQDNRDHTENDKKEDNHENIFKEQQSYPIQNKSRSHIFQGFKTAGNKPIELSLDTFAKSKKNFENMDTDCEEQQTSMEMEKQTELVSKPHTFLGFNTANNKKVNISGEAFLKSRQLLQNTELVLKNDSKCFKDPNVSVSHILKKVLKKPTNTFNHSAESEKGNDDFTLDTDDIICENDVFDINTEIIKDFETTVYTEDFIKTETPKSKRSGSPILSCPKAKKKKFITPIKTSKFVAPIIRKSSITFDTTNIYEFNQNYKISKKYTLKDINEMEKINNIKNVDPYVLNFKFETLLDFVFTGNRNDIDSDSWTTDKIIKIFTDSVNKRIIPDGWMENHLKLIIWKLLSYEIRFPSTMRDVCTVKNVLEQLKYRYKRELYNVERPALRKILEKDEVSTRRMVLCVAGLFVEGVSLNSVKNQTQNIELLLTEGWYTVKACADRMIDRLVCEGKIGVGTKLAVHGAELLNCEQGISPWEDTSSVRLKISGNATRRAKWDARLGFHGNGAILSRLSAVKPEGGKISRLRAFVTRVYPTLYIEKFPDGSTLTRSERLEHLYQMKYETERQMQMEKLYEELGRFSDQESQDSEGAEDGGLDSGSQISRLMKRSRDRDEFRANLTGTQTRLLQEHAIKKNDKLVQALQDKFLELVKTRGLDAPRNVVPLMKIRVVDVEPGGRSTAMITIWKPNETLQEMLTEGTWIDVYNVFPTSIRHSELQISASRQSVFQRSKIEETDKLKALTRTLRRRCYPIKELQNPSMNTDYNEIDTVGLIFLMEPQTKEFETSKQPFQNVYLTDENKNFMCVNFWGGTEKFGFQNILDTGQVVTCVNLQKRAGNTRKNIPQYRATEFTYFTKTSKIDAVRKVADDLTAKFSTLDKRKFIEDCVALKNNYHNIKPGNAENVSPYRLNTSDYNVYKNKVFIDSPLVNKCADVNLNLTGLDFGSTFKQTDETQHMSPQMLMRKRKVNEKIARLKMYGEPPPLSPVHLINKSSNAVKAYKSPFTNEVSKSVASPSVIPQKRVENNDDSHQNCRGSEDNVANLRALPQSGEECESNVTSSHILPNKIDSSPVLGINRTYVKRSSINPVKLNFSNAIDTSITDAFGEEFEYSPPLSLDANFIT